MNELQLKQCLYENDVRGFMDQLKPTVVNKIIDTATSNRLIHVACNKGFFQIVEVLISNKCNLEYGNKIGWRPIHHCCANGHLNIVQLLLMKDCDFNCTANDGMAPIHFACANGYLEIVRELISKNCNLNCQTNQGWTPIHWAACNGHLEIVSCLIENRCDAEVLDKDGCLPLLIACAIGHLDIVKLLINCTKRINPFVKKGFSFNTKCLEYLDQIRHSDQIFKCLKNNNLEEFKKIYGPISLFSIQIDTGLSLLELALQENLNNIIEIIMNKYVTDDEFSNVIKFNNFDEKAWSLIQECFLHRCIKHHHAEGFKFFNTPQTINPPHLLIQSSFLETAVEFSSQAFIQEILQKTIYDEQVWNRAKDFAQKNNQKKIFTEISNRESLLLSRKQANLSILHTAVCDNDPEMVKYILDNPSLADKDLNNSRIGTALAFAHLLHHKPCIDVLEQYNVDPNTQNKLFETSLHEAIASGMRSNCQYLIDKSLDIDKKNCIGLTGLHCAVIKGFEDVCEKLINKGADCTKYIEDVTQSWMGIKESILPLTKKENSLTLCIKIHGTIYSCLLDKLDRHKLLNIIDENDNSLLHMAALSLHSDMCSFLLQSGLIVDKINNKSNTALMELLIEKFSYESQNILDKITSIVKILVEFDADINKISVNGDSLLTLASRFHNEGLMLILVSKSVQLNNITNTNFLLTFKNKWFEFADKILNLLSDDFLMTNISLEIIKMCMEHKQVSLIKSLFHKANENVQNSILEDIIYYSTEIADEELFLCMIDKELNDVKLFDNGETLMTNLLLEKKLNFCRKILKSKNCEVYINSNNIKKKCPLQVAIDVDDMDMIDELIIVTSEFNHVDDDGQTPLTQLFRKVSTFQENSVEPRLLSIIKLIIRFGGDINHVLQSGDPIINLITQCDIKNDIVCHSNRWNR